jgi:hypothetical protein
MAGVPPLAHVLTAVMPPAPAAKKYRRGSSVVLQGEGVWRYAWGDGAYCPCAAYNAAEQFNDQIFDGSARFCNV